MDAPFKTIGEVNAYEENEVVKIQARGLPEATQKKRIRDRDRDRVGIRATALRDRDRASIEVGASYAASLVLVLVSLFSIGQVTEVSGWTVLGRFYSHLAFCNYFWPVRYRVGIVGIRNLGYRRRDRELDTCPSRYHQKMLGIIPIRRYWYLGCDTESIPSRFLRNVRIVKKWAIPC